MKRKPLTREEREYLVTALEECRERDPEEGHIMADRVLLDFIDDEQVRLAHKAAAKWYA